MKSFGIKPSRSGEGFDLVDQLTGGSPATHEESPLPLPNLFGGLASAASAVLGPSSGHRRYGWAAGWAD